MGCIFSSKQVQTKILITVSREKDTLAVFNSISKELISEFKITASQKIDMNNSNVFLIQLIQPQRGTITVWDIAAGDHALTSPIHIASLKAKIKEHLK